MLVTPLLHVVERSPIMSMDRTRQAVAVVTITAEAEDEEMNIANAALPAVGDVAHLLQRDPMVLLANG
jgi:hypothetical protein